MNKNKFDMRLLLCLIVFNFCISKGYTQCDRFIEIVIRDTLIVEGDEFTYMIKIIEDHYLNEVIQKEDKNGTPLIINKFNLEALISNKGGVLMSGFDEDKFQVSIEDQLEDEETVIAKFYKKSELKNFVIELSQYSNVYGLIVGIKGGREININNLLSKKILEKGKVRAEQIALMMGGKLGDIIEVSENILDSNTYNGSSWNLNSAIGWTAPPSFNAMDEMIGFGKSSTIIRSKTLRIKYAVLD